MITNLLNLPTGLAIQSVTTTSGQIRVVVASTAEQAPCPLCYTPSSQLHSHYWRQLADVPCGGRRVVLRVRSHKWRCVHLACPRRVFAERLTPLARAWAHMTNRLATSLQAIGLAANGQEGARLAHQVGMHTSPTTVLNRIKTLPDPFMPPPEEIGLDEWSYRRGKRFGTIIVDLQRHRVLDLLPDKDVATVVAWLIARPTIRLVSRDRSREFAQAVALGAPQAIQVLDRFHLLRNLVEHLPTIVSRCLTEVRRAAAGPPIPAPPQSPLTGPLSMPSLPEQGPWKPALTRQAEAQRLARQTERNARYAQVQALREQGLTAAEIGQQMGMKPRTVRHWFTHFRSDTHKRKHRSEFDQYADYVRQRWQAGCHNGLMLWRELHALGYSGSPKSVYQYLLPLRQATPPSVSNEASSFQPSSPPPATITSTPEVLAMMQRWTLTQTQWFLVKRPAELTAEERAYVTALCRAHSTLATVSDLVQQFRQLVRERPGEAALRAWVSACQTSQVKELVRFAKGLRAEWQAVVAGLTHPASQGQTEGFVHKLKLIKRQHFGRAGFTLLRKHVLLAG